MPHTPHGVNFESNRPVVMGRNGMVCAGHPLAAQAGMAALQRGGNAVDAAIATAAALNVVEPNMSGVGGDGFIMIYNRQAGTIDVCNGTGAAPYATDVDWYRSNGIPAKGILSVSVPGLVDAWMAAHAKYGTLSRAEVFDAAIDLSENGFPTTHVLSGVIAGDRLLCEFPDSQAVFAPGGVPMRPGQILRQPGLARTFQAIVDGGRDAFYEGETARALVRFSEQQGGILSLKDLADCRSRWEAPISTTYHGTYRLRSAPQLQWPRPAAGTEHRRAVRPEGPRLQHPREHPPHGRGQEAGLRRPRGIHGRPRLCRCPRRRHALQAVRRRARPKLIDPDRAAEAVSQGDPWSYQPANFARRPGAKATAGAMQEEDTTCFVVVDRWGNAVCQLQSIQSSLGSSIVAGETGILLNNRMTYWHLDPDHVDCLQPGKRVRHTMNPIMVFRNTGEPRHAFQNGGSTSRSNGVGDSGHGRLALVCGTPGADTQVQTNLQVITHVLDFGMTVAEAVEAPRWRNTHSPTESNIPHECDNLLYVESRFPTETLDGLRQRGHTLEVMHGWGASGSEMMIQVDGDAESAVLQGAADPRRDGYAIGW